MKKFLFLFLPFLLMAESSFNFLNMPFISKSNALGNIKSVVNSGVENLFNNPSLINLELKNHIALNYQKAYLDMNTYKFGYMYSVDSSLGVGFNLLNSKITNIEVRNKPGDPQSKFDYNIIISNIGFSYKLYHNIVMGASFNYANQNLLIDDESAYFINLGLYYNNIIECLDAGVYIDNIGESTGMRNVKSKLPKLFGIGINYKFNEIYSDLLPVLYYEYENNITDKSNNTKIALSIDYKQKIVVMLGYMINNDVYKMTYGFGISFENYYFLYSYLPIKYGLGNNHSVTLKINW